MTRRQFLLLASVMLIVAAGYLLFWRTRGSSTRTSFTPPRRILFVTIDTLRADRVGTYGYAAARTPALDGLARRGVRFDRAYAPAPITLPSHASMLTGLYPPRHGSRHNGIRMSEDVQTLATVLKRAGFETAAFVGAFPLDRQFGLARGFDVYSDEMPRDSSGRPANERPGRMVVDDALRWLRDRAASRWFAWVHLFEPHAPYGPPGGGGATPVSDRYDGEIAETDRQIARLLEMVPAGDDTLAVVAGDHGEAFGEHGEIGHSIFVYDTTLRVPFILAGAGVPPGVVVDQAVGLVDVLPTVLDLLRLEVPDRDGVSLLPALGGGRLGDRELYAESYAPLFDFGWSGLRTIRSAEWKFIDAPRRELYDIVADPGEQIDRAHERRQLADTLARSAARHAAPDGSRRAAIGDEAIRRLQALGYAGGTRESGVRADPKDRKELAAAIAQVTSGELNRDAQGAALQRILELDPKNPQAHMRLGILLMEDGRCDPAAQHLSVAIASGIPTADPYLALASCAAAAGNTSRALALLQDGARIEPDNPVIEANLGIVLAQTGRFDDAVKRLRLAVDRNPDLHQARFTLAVVLAKSGRRADARAEAETLLRRLPPTAPQRGEIERLIAALQ